MNEIKYLDLAGLTTFKEKLDDIRESDNLSIAEALNDLNNNIGDGTLTIKKNGTSQGTFTANLKTNSEINITVPTNISDLGLTAITEIQNLIRYGQLDVSDLTNELKLALHETIASTYDYLSDASVEDKLEAYGKIIHYDSASQKIQLKNGNTILSEFSAADFIVDGFLNDVKITQGTGDNVGKTVLLFDFNTESGVTDIEIPLEDIFDASNYYTKTEIDNKIVQSDWNQTNTTASDYIKNKPAAVTESTVTSWGFTKNTGTVVGIKIGQNSTINPDSQGVVTLPEYLDFEIEPTSSADTIINTLNLR